MELTERIAQLLEEKYREDEFFNDCFTVAIELKPTQRLHVFADSDTGMTFEKCQKLSRFLESHLDTNGWLGERYVLEVSSPGIGRPLKFPRQYVRNIGRTIAVTTTNGEQYKTLLKHADDSQITLYEKIIEKIDKKKTEREIETQIPYDQIKQAIIQI